MHVMNLYTCASSSTSEQQGLKEAGIQLSGGRVAITAALRKRCGCLEASNKARPVESCVIRLSMLRDIVRRKEHVAASICVLWACDTTWHPRGVAGRTRKRGQTMVRLLLPAFN